MSTWSADLLLLRSNLLYAYWALLPTVLGYPSSTAHVSPHMTLLVNVSHLPPDLQHIAQDILSSQLRQELITTIRDACTNAAAPFCWLRVAGYRSLSKALAAASVDAHQLHLQPALDQTYSQILEAVISTLDRSLLLQPESAVQLSDPQSDAFMGCSMAHATEEETVSALIAMQGVSLTHRPTRTALGSWQYMQLIMQRAQQSRTVLPHATHALAAILYGNTSAQEEFVAGGGPQLAAHAAADTSKSPTEAQEWVTFLRLLVSIVRAAEEADGNVKHGPAGQRPSSAILKSVSVLLSKEQLATVQQPLEFG